VRKVVNARATAQHSTLCRSTTSLFGVRLDDRLHQRRAPAGKETALQAGLAKLDLVTREEFEVQRAVLLKTREKLDALEAAVRELEQGRTGAE